MTYVNDENIINLTSIYKICHILNSWQLWHGVNTTSFTWICLWWNHHISMCHILCSWCHIPIMNRQNMPCVIWLRPSTLNGKFISEIITVQYRAKSRPEPEGQRAIPLTEAETAMSETCIRLSCNAYFRCNFNPPFHIFTSLSKFEFVI